MVSLLQKAGYSFLTLGIIKSLQLLTATICLHTEQSLVMVPPVENQRKERKKSHESRWE